MSGASTTIAPTPTLVTDGQVITIADTTGRLLTCGLKGVAVCIAEPQLVQNEASKTQWRVQLLKNGFFKLQSIHDGSLLMAERCYKDPHVTDPKGDVTSITSAFASFPAFANTSALTTTLNFAEHPLGLPRNSGPPINGVSDLAGFEQAMQAAQTMWAYTSKCQMVCAYDLIWQSFYSTKGISEAAMQVDGMVSAQDLQTCVDLLQERVQGHGGKWFPHPTKMRMLTSVVLPPNGPVAMDQILARIPDTFPSPGGLATAAWFGSTPPRWVEHPLYRIFGGADPQQPNENDIRALTAIDDCLCTTWLLDAVSSDEVLVGGLFCPLISSSFAPELIPGANNAPMQVPAYMIKVQTTVKPGATKTGGNSITYGVKIADVAQKTPVALVCNGDLQLVYPGTTFKVESEFATRELNISYISNGLAACPLAISYLALDGVPLEENEAFTFVLDPSDAHSPKLSKLSGDDLQSLNPAAKKDECDKAASAIRALHAALASPLVGRPAAVPGLPGRRLNAFGDFFQHTIGDNISNGAKKAGGAISEGAKKAGGAISDGAKKAGGAIVDGAKQAGGAIADGAKQAADAIADEAKQAAEKIKDAGENAGSAIKGNVIDPAISGVTAAADTVASTATSEAWNVVHLAESGKDILVDTANAFTNEVMNGVRVLVTIEGKLAHYVAQGVQDVVGFARLCLQQLEIALEKIEEFLKLWLDFGDFQVTRDCLGNLYTDIRDKVFLNRAFFIDPVRDYLEGQVHGLENAMDSAFASLEEYLGVKLDDNQTPNINSVTMKAFNLAYSALTWLLDKITRLLPSGAFQVDVAATDKIIQDIFGAVLDKYKEAPDISSAFADVMEDMLSAITKLATGTSNAVFGQLLKTLHTVAKAAFGAIEWGIDVMADLIYYGFKATFEIMELAGADLGDLLIGAFGWLADGLRLFGVHFPTFTMMDMALWPQAIMLTLIVKSYGTNAWNSFKATKGHLLEGLPMTLTPSGDKSANAKTVSVQAPRSVMLTASKPAPFGRVLVAEAGDANAAEADPKKSDDGSGQEGKHDSRIFYLRLFSLVADIVYGGYYARDVMELAAGNWGEGAAMWAGSCLKTVSVVFIMVEQCLVNPADATPILLYNSFVLTGVFFKVAIRKTAPPEKKGDARKFALGLSALFNAVATVSYVGKSVDMSIFDGYIFGAQLTNLCYVALQAYVAIEEAPNGGLKMLPLSEHPFVWGAAFAILSTKIGLDSARIAYGPKP